MESNKRHYVDFVLEDDDEEKLNSENVEASFNVKFELWGLCPDASWVLLFDNSNNDVSLEDFESLKERIDNDVKNSKDDGSLDTPLVITSVDKGDFVVVPEPRFFLALKTKCYRVTE